MKINRILKLIEKDPRFFPWSVERETATYIASLAKLLSVKNFLEIGTHLGYTSFKVVENTTDCKVTTVDRLDTCIKYVKLIPKSDKKRFKFIHAEIKLFYKRLKIKDKYDLVFIDAEHSYQAVYSDFLSLLPHIRINGVIAIHDVYNDGVKQFIELLNNVNRIFLNNIYEIIVFRTPKKPEVRHNFRSGLAIIKIKNKNLLLSIINKTIMQLIYKLQKLTL